MSDITTIIRSYGGDQTVDEAALAAAGRYQYGLPNVYGFTTAAAQFPNYRAGTVRIRNGTGRCRVALLSSSSGRGWCAGSGERAHRYSPSRAQKMRRGAGIGLRTGRWKLPRKVKNMTPSGAPFGGFYPCGRPLCSDGSQDFPSIGLAAFTAGRP